MSPQTEEDQKAEAWFNEMLPKLRYEQDYSICFVHSKDMLDKDGKQEGIQIRRPFIRLFSTGVTKLYKMQVLGEKFEDVEYSEEQMKQMDQDTEKAEEWHDKNGWKS